MEEEEEGNVSDGGPKEWQKTRGAVTVSSMAPARAIF